MKQIIILIFFIFSLVNAKEYQFLEDKNVQNFINKMVTKHHFDRVHLEYLFRNAKLDRDTLARYVGKRKPNTTDGSWVRYKTKLLDDKSIAYYKEQKQKYIRVLEKASREYKVPINIIVGFLAIESKFGKYSGDYSVWNSLVTLSFFNNRKRRYFYSELGEYLLFCREQNYDPLILKSSFAGAMGNVQQMPSIARRFLIDYNRDGKKDPWSMSDAIGSIAKFLRSKNWEYGGDIAIKSNFKGKRYRGLRVGYNRRYSIKELEKYSIKPIKEFNSNYAYLLKLKDKTKDEIWLGAKNFRVITRYNPSTNYGMAIFKISQKLGD